LNRHGSRASIYSVEYSSVEKRKKPIKTGSSYKCSKLCQVPEIIDVPQNFTSS
jgi:hypothetical protein